MSYYFPFAVAINIGYFTQRAKKVVSDNAGLVDFAIGLVNSVFNLPGASDLFLRNLNNRRTVRPILLFKKLLELVEMTSGLVNVSFSFKKSFKKKKDFLCTLPQGARTLY